MNPIRRRSLQASALVVACACAIGPPTTANAQVIAAGDALESSPGDRPTSLLDLPLEELLTLESTSVAKKRQRVADSAAAVYVITQEDIRRSAARTIPDLLRGVPGVEVAQVYTGGYAVSIRGFNGILSNALLVMVDGRSIYVSSLSAVLWEQLLIPLDDIERIEVVRGPGATLWGANAVNGVINIITKHSADMQGTQIDARAGPRFQDFSLSHGGRISDGFNYRVYGNYRRDQALLLADGKPDGRDLYGYATGARLDWEPNDRDAITMQADYAKGHYAAPSVEFNQDPANPVNQITDETSRFSNISVLTRWKRTTSSDLDWSIQASYGRIHRDDTRIVEFTWQMADVDFDLHWKADDVNDINVGLDTRVMHDKVADQRLFTLMDNSQTDRWISGYVQDDISIIPRKLRLTLGIKLEDNNFTGFEFQPSARLFFRPNRTLSLWTAVSRAIRTPSRLERSANYVQAYIPADSPGNPSPLPAFPTLIGESQNNTSQLVAFEAGLRANLPASWSIDIAGYYNIYDNLSTTSVTSATPVFIGQNPFPVGVDLGIGIQFLGKGRSYGVESVLKGNITRWWQTELTWSHFEYSIGSSPDTAQPYRLLFPLNFSPRDQISLRNIFNIGRKLSLNGQLRYVSRLVGPGVPAYANADIRISWQLASALELSVIGESLLHNRRAEFSLTNYHVMSSYQPRQVSAQLRFRF